MPEFRVGTCSWKYDSWQGLVYSCEPGRDYLKEYAGVFNTVEVDQWFWSLHGIDKITMPQKSTVLNYKNSVPPDFKFSIKVPNSITLTHYYKSGKNEPLIPNPHFLSTGLLTQFLESVNPLNDNLGPLMFQFEYLNKEKMKSQKEFLGLMNRFTSGLPAGINFAVETRNPNYLNEDYFRFLYKNRLAHVFLQGYYMPPVFDLYGKYKNDIKEFTVIRLHGPDRKGMEERADGEWNKIIEPRDAELERIAAMIVELLDREVDVYLNVNNHYEGSAPLTILKLKELLPNK
jgi:uncharacterized protein YecE (DUF72 family)